MITPDHVRTMARYNAWQNDGLITCVSDLDHAVVTEDRGAFFGSVLGTLSHLLWGDGIWMSRFDGGDRPAGGIPESASLTKDLVSWEAARRQMDARITAWAKAVDQDELDSELRWFSGAAGREVSRSRALCIVHMFNHQTHHRGQVHTLLTELGLKPGDTDLFLMPDS